MQSTRTPNRLPIIYEDNHIIAVVKPAGMLTQGDNTGDRSLVEEVKDYIKYTYNKAGSVYLGLVHRLDRPVGGVVLLAKTSKAAGRLSEQFRNQRIKKTYLAVTENLPQPPHATLTHYLLKLAGKNVVKAFNKPVNGSQTAVLTYKVLSAQNRKTLLQIEPLTGRQHQIRVQLARIACPLCGDVKYGKHLQPLPAGNIALYAYQIMLEHPVSRVLLTIEAPFPSTFPFSLFDVPKFEA